MDFIERWLHISPDGGNGASELTIAIVVIAVVSMVIVALRNHFPKNFIEFLEQFGKRGSSGRFDN